MIACASRAIVMRGNVAITAPASNLTRDDPE